VHYPFFLGESSQLRSSTRISKPRKDTPPAPLLQGIQPGEMSYPCGGEWKLILVPFKAFDPNDATVSLKPPTAITQRPKVSTQSKRIASNDTQESKHFIATLQEFLEVDDENDFVRGLAGYDKGQEVETLAKWPASFLLHHKVCACLGRAKETWAQEAALIIIWAIIQAYNPAADQNTRRKDSTSSNNSSNKEESQDGNSTKNSLKLLELATR
jgi:hypothetical protein